MNKDAGFRMQDAGCRIQDAGFASLSHMRRKGGRGAESRIPNPGSSKGFSLVSAIFLLVVIAALGVFAVTLSTTQQQGAALDVLGARAYQASRAGIEWGAYQILQNSGVGFAPACRPGPASSSVALAGTLADFTVTVGCSAASAVEGAAYPASSPLWVYQLSSTATHGTAAAPDYVERQVQVTIAR